MTISNPNTRAKMSSKQKLLSRLGWTLLAIPTLALVVVIGFHIAYMWIEPSLSPSAQAWMEKMEALPKETDAAYRFMGLQAPKGADTAAFGKCLHDHAMQFGIHSGPYPDPIESRECHPDAALTLPQSNAERDNLKLIPGADVEDPWEVWAQQEFEPVLEARARELMESNEAFQFEVPMAAVPGYLGHRLVHRKRLGLIVREWRRGHAAAPLEELLALERFHLRYANNGVLPLAMAVTDLRDVLLTAQHMLNSAGNGHEAALWPHFDRLLEMDAPLTEAIDQAFVNQWRETYRIGSSIANLDVIAKDQGQDTETHPINPAGRLLFEFLHHENVNLNEMAEYLDDERLKTHAAAQGAAVTARVDTCQPRHWLGVVWKPKPVSRVLALCTQAWQLTDYGTRVADLRNLAAATRLTLEARRQGIAPGAVSADWVRDAPVDMRDVFTGEPFEYDAERKVLRTLLREKAGPLGKAGDTYELPI